MAIVVIGLNHRSAPLEVLERLAVDTADLPKLLADVSQRDHVTESVIVSTCNRTEIYAVVERFHDAYAGLRGVLTEHADVAVAAVADHLTVDSDEAAAAHLFSVASGLDSAVIGETEILGQLKSAWRTAHDVGTVGPQLDALFRHALHVGKRARTETAISRSIASASAAAVALATRRLEARGLDGLVGRRVLVLGSGAMGEQMAVALAGAGVAAVDVANRTVEHAEALATRVGGRPVAFDDVADVLVDADVLFTSTGAVTQVINRDTITRVVAARGGRPLVIVDIAVPRDVDPRVAELDGVELYDMDDIARFTEAGMARRRGEVDAVEAIIEDELVRYTARRNARSVAPVIATLHARSDEMRRAELERFAARVDGLTDRQSEAVEALTRRIVAKMLHEPSVLLAELAASVRGDRIVDALGDFYDLDDAEPEPDAT